MAQYAEKTSVASDRSRAEIERTLVIKAKLEAVEAGIVTFDEEFAMHFLLPNGQTVGEWVAPQIEQVYAQGAMPALLPGGSR